MMPYESVMNSPADQKHHRAKLGVFISGGGRSLLNLHDATTTGALPSAEREVPRVDADISIVVASRACAGAERAMLRGLSVITHRSVLAASDLLSIVNEHKLDLVVLAGYLKLLPIPAELTGRVVNIHPALLPKFGGPGMYGHYVHEAVIASGDNISGCTVHYCTGEYDKGSMIVQRTCPVLREDTPSTLADRVFLEELIALPMGINIALATRMRI